MAWAQGIITVRGKISSRYYLQTMLSQSTVKISLLFNYIFLVNLLIFSYSIFHFAESAHSIFDIITVARLKLTAGMI